MTETWREVAETCLGWLHPAEGPALQRYANQAVDKCGSTYPMAEIGGYAGKSACWLGGVARYRDVILFSIDWHRGSPEMASDRECHHPEMIGHDGLFDSLPHFRSNIRKAGLESHVVPVAGDSRTVGRYWGIQLSLLFIDGGHDGETVESDFLWWHQNVVPGGFLLFHDATIPEIGGTADAAVESGRFQFVEQVDSLRVLRRR